MHGPAPVSLEAAGDTGAWRRCTLGLHLVTAVALLAWRPGWWTALAALVLGLMAVAAWRVDKQPACGRLHWDGQRWTLDERSVHPLPVFDLGDWLLLRVRLHGTWRPLWWPLSARRVGAAWVPLRAALYAAPARAVSPTGRPTP